MESGRIAPDVSKKGPDPRPCPNSTGSEEEKGVGCLRRDLSAERGTGCSGDFRTRIRRLSVHAGIDGRKRKDAAEIVGRERWSQDCAELPQFSDRVDLHPEEEGASRRVGGLFWQSSWLVHLFLTRRGKGRKSDEFLRGFVYTLSGTAREGQDRAQLFSSVDK